MRVTPAPSIAVAIRYGRETLPMPHIETPVYRNRDDAEAIGGGWRRKRGTALAQRTPVRGTPVEIPCGTAAGCNPRRPVFR